MKPNLLEQINTESTILTTSGKYLDILDPQPEMIDIEDIATGLCHQPRWAGQMPAFYSVASHSIHVLQMVPEEYRLEALLHDATEAYIGDMPKPFKKHMPGFQMLEARLDQVIRRKFGLPTVQSKVVKEADLKALEFEWTHFKTDQRFRTIDRFSQVRYDFMTYFDNLYKGEGGKGGAK
jgi:5'-deoxynucleotidase YfbR-like HD superfamily hydrolase